MTRTHAVPPVDAPDVAAALRVLRERGLRASTARRLVLGMLYAAEGPLTAEQLAGGLDGVLPQSDPASVYRNLEVLEEVGLVRHLHIGHGPGRYVGANVPRQEYLMCEECGALRAVEPHELDKARALIQRQFGHEAHFTHFPLAGLCSDCAGGGEDKPRRRA